MNPVIGAQLKKYAEGASLTTYSESDQFEVYSIFSILCGHLGESSDPLDAHLIGSEFGLDGVAILLQGEIVQSKNDVIEKLEFISNPEVEFVFFQSKTGNSFDYGNISKFYDSIEAFFDGNMRSESQALAELTDAMEAIYAHAVARKNPSIRAFYATTGNYDAPQRIEKLRSNFYNNLLDKNIFDKNKIQIEFCGAAELQGWYRAATTAVEAEIDFERAIAMPENAKVAEAYVGYLSAEQLVKLFTLPSADGVSASINRSVFVDNIRDYNPKSKINLEIRDSVRQGGGGEFIFRNNGITLVSKGLRRTGDRFVIEDFQIVNGCQTCNIIFDLLYGGDVEEGGRYKLLKELAVPFRLISSRDDEFVASIIVGTNRQNPVREEQFWALRPFLKNLEEYAASAPGDAVIYLERRENQYRGRDVERVRIVQPSTLMKSIAAVILHQPHRAGRDYRGIVSEFDGKLFQNEHDVTIYHAVCFLHYRLDFLWRNQRLDTKYKVYRFYILSAVGVIATGGADIFSQTQSNTKKMVAEILSLANDEERFVETAIEASTLVEKLQPVSGSGETSRARDSLRSEALAKAFISEWKKLAVS